MLKGVTIGDNCIIGYGSTVMKDIPANSVAVGTPTKVICTIEEYFNKRKQVYVNELFELLMSWKDVREELCNRLISQMIILHLSTVETYSYTNFPIRRCLRINHSLTNSWKYIMLHLMILMSLYMYTNYIS